MVFAGWTAGSEQLRISSSRARRSADGVGSQARLRDRAAVRVRFRDRGRLQALGRRGGSRRGRGPAAAEEVALVGTDPDGTLCGVSTAYLQRNEQLGCELWHLRAFVSAEHRAGHLAANLLFQTLALTRERFASGNHPEAPGAIIEIESPDIQRTFPEAVWMPTRFYFISRARAAPISACTGSRAPARLRRRRPTQRERAAGCSAGSGSPPRSSWRRRYPRSGRRRAGRAAGLPSDEGEGAARATRSSPPSASPR